ncbi:MAG TPA: family 1 glycosylhydrolase, partial [Chloroflexota bacterium]|nr:family 1 glycosylhydrolase [Chloroflexota bacterium]
MVDKHGSLTFPPSFLWGTATASHQVEGGNANNDWWNWEQSPGHIRDGTVSGLACDHYRRYREDFDLLSDLHQNAHRLSLEWSRIEPRPGEFDKQAIRHYRDVLEYLRRRDVEPVVTVHHFSNPIWLS